MTEAAKNGERELLGAVDQSVNYLRSADALASLEHDPYWPKWHSPWWHMTLLWEMGLASRIPRATASAMVRSIDRRYSKVFPLKPEEIPPGKNLQQDVGCHCALGTMYQVLCDCGIDMDRELPWIRPWFLKYQLPDGGLNCDERAYSKAHPKSSIVSTLPPLEAVLFHTHRPFTEDEERFLDRGADYLVSHKLFRSVGAGGKVINGEWLKLCFPRFYEYDVLRGAEFLIQWAVLLDRELPIKAAIESVDLLFNTFPDGPPVKPQRFSFTGKKTLATDAAGRWTGAEGVEASMFPLLVEASRLDRECEPLSAQWLRVVRSLRNLRENGRLLIDHPDEFRAWTAH